MIELSMLSKREKGIAPPGVASVPMSDPASDEELEP
jgi:hypothetical protein